jgi:hypothetical protein
MDLAPEVTQLSLDRAVHVLVLGEIPGGILRDLGEPCLCLGELEIREQARGMEPLRVLDARLAVVREQLRVVGVEEGPDGGIE